VKTRRGFIAGLLAIPFVGKATQARPEAFPIPKPIGGADPTMDAYMIAYRERLYFTTGDSVYLSEWQPPAYAQRYKGEAWIKS
jgi:hypothetical protein